MAKGYTRIDNDLFEFLYNNKLNASELKVLLFLIRYTKGFNRDTARAGYSYIAKGVGITTETARKAVKKLSEEGIVSVIHPAQGSAAQVLQLLYKNCTPSHTRTLVPQLQGTLDDRVQGSLHQDTKEDITNYYIKEEEREISDSEWEKMLKEGFDD